MRLPRRAGWLPVVAIILTGCTPPWSAEFPTPPLAIRTISSGGVEVLIVPCSPVRVVRFEVTVPREVVQHADDPRIWQVDFSPPVTDLRRMVLGQLPAGGTEQVRWPSTGLGEQPDRHYVVRVVLDDDHYSYEAFSQARLASGRILLHDRPVSPETFTDQSRCPS